MLTYVDSTTPNEAGLWQWLKRYTGAESETTIEKYVGFQRARSNFSPSKMASIRRHRGYRVR